MLARARELLSFHREVKSCRPQSLDSLLDFCFSRPIRPFQIRRELAELVNMVAKLKPKNVLEIGTAQGGTLWLWCRVADPGAKIVSVDLRSGKFGGGYHWAKIPLYKAFAEKGQHLRLIRGDSHAPATFAQVKREFLGKIDFLFIDGDHSYAGVKQDFEMYSGLVRKGGLIAFHDIVLHSNQSGCEVSRLWNEIKGNYEHGEVVGDRSQGWAGIGIIRI